MRHLRHLRRARPFDADDGIQISCLVVSRTGICQMAAPTAWYGRWRRRYFLGAELKIDCALDETGWGRVAGPGVSWRRFYSLEAELRPTGVGALGLLAVNLRVVVSRSLSTLYRLLLLLATPLNTKLHDLLFFFPFHGLYVLDVPAAKILILRVDADLLCNKSCNKLQRKCRTDAFLNKFIR